MAYLGCMRLETGLQEHHSLRTVSGELEIIYLKIECKLLPDQSVSSRAVAQ